jgi:hypothetical protein
VGLPVDHRFFDSADWALSKQQQQQQAQRPLNPLAPHGQRNSQPAGGGATLLPPGLPAGGGAAVSAAVLAPPKLEPSAPPGPRGPSHLGAR